jgi:MYXO-CTERM domain-containing protein
MAAGGVLWSLAVSSFAAAAVVVPPSELVIDGVPGYELTSGPTVDLTYADYAELQPDSVAHLDPESEAATGMIGAVEEWTAGDRSIVIEVIRAIDDKSATTFVDQTAANAIAVGLGATDPPFGGAWSYSGGLDDWTNVVSWSQGPYAVTLTLVSRVETDRAPIDAAAVRQAEAILDATGATVSDEAAVDDEAPPPPTEATIPSDTDGEDFPTGVVVVVLVLAALAVAGVVAGRRRRSDDETADDGTADDETARVLGS